MEDFLRILKQQDGEVTAFSEKLWCGLLDYATDRECFYCIALKTISDCSRIFRLVALSKAVDLGLIWTIRALGLI